MLVILALIAMCNGSETAITSVTPIRLKALITHSSRPKKQKDRFKKIYKLAREFNQTLAAILFASTLCNTALATIATLFFYYSGAKWRHCYLNDDTDHRFAGVVSRRNYP